MTDYTPVDCAIHDCLEVACLYRYQLKITLSNGKTQQGIAQNWISDREKIEYLVVSNQSETAKIRLDQIKHIDVLTTNAKFTEINF